MKVIQRTFHSIEGSGYLKTYDDILGLSIEYWENLYSTGKSFSVVPENFSTI